MPCNLTSLLDVMLIVHCRQTGEVCEQRRPLLLEYSMYFKEVVFFLNHNSSWPLARLCLGPGDPYRCIAEEMSRTSASGILYMQFDVGISPCALAQVLDVEKVANFEKLSYSSFHDVENCNKGFGRLGGHWAMPRSKVEGLSARDLVATHVFFLLRWCWPIKLPAKGTWQGNTELFYLPRGLDGCAENDHVGTSLRALGDEFQGNKQPIRWQLWWLELSKLCDVGSALGPPCFRCFRQLCTQGQDHAVAGGATWL